MLKFSEVKALENGVKKIFVRSGEGEPLRIVTGKCLSYGVKKSEKYNTKTILLLLLLFKIFYNDNPSAISFTLIFCFTRGR